MSQHLGGVGCGRGGAWAGQAVVGGAWVRHGRGREVCSHGHGQGRCLQCEMLFSHWRYALLPPGSFKILILHIPRNMMIRNTHEFALGSSVSVPENSEFSEAAPSTGDKGLLTGQPGPPGGTGLAPVSPDGPRTVSHRLADPALGTGATDEPSHGGYPWGRLAPGTQALGRVSECQAACSSPFLTALFGREPLQPAHPAAGWGWGEGSAWLCPALSPW